MISIEEMFNISVKGLRSQGFTVCALTAEEDEVCVYYKDDGNGNITHCAWGWVDPIGTKYLDSDNAGTSALTVHDLHRLGIGIAAGLESDSLKFASDLQYAHDSSNSASLERNLRALATEYGLTWPA